MSIKLSNESRPSGVINLLGPSGSGKTFAAATFSADFPHERVQELTALSASKGSDAVRAALKDAPWVTLRDMLWVPFDAGALDGLSAFKINVPSIDVQAAYDANRDVEPDSPTFGMPIMERVIAMLTNEVQAHAKATPAHAATCWDTISAADFSLQAYVFNKYSEKQIGLAYNAIDKAHQNLVSRTAAPGRFNIFNFHLEAVTDPVLFSKSDEAKKIQADTKTKQDALKIADAGKFSLAVYRKARRFYQAHGSEQLGVRCTLAADGKTFQRSLLTETDSSSGVEARVRAEILCEPREPVNLRALLRKLGKLP